MNIKNLGNKAKDAASKMKTIKKTVFFAKILAIFLIVLLFLAFIINISNFMGALFKAYTRYSVDWDYSSLDDKNLDTEQLSYDLLYETFYETISETSYYQVFNTKYTVQNQDGTGTFNTLRWGAFFKNTFVPNYLLSEDEDDKDDVSAGAVFGSMVSDFMHNVFGTDNMDIRMTVHDANWRTISDMQKALAFSDYADSDSKALESQLGLFRDYYGRENDFALSTGLLKELNNKVLNLPEGNANEKSIIYPETFTKPVQFVKDYYRVKPVHVDPVDEEDANYAFEDYTYITRRILYEDLADNNLIPVTSGLLKTDAWKTNSSVENFMDEYVSASEILGKFNTKSYHGEDTDEITLSDKYVNDDKSSKSLTSIFDLEGFITSVPSPYIYDYVVLERNNRKNFQSANSDDFDYIAMNNVAKYATVKEYNGYSENPTEKQIRLYWKMVSFDCDKAPQDWEEMPAGFPNNLITTPINSADNIINFARNYKFTKVSNDEDKLGEPAGYFGTMDFGGLSGKSFVYTSEGILNNGNSQYTFLVGPFASAKDAESNNFIPAYKSDELDDVVARPLDGFSDFADARICVIYDDDGNYGYRIEYKNYPVTRKVVEDNTEPFKTYSEPIEPENEEDPVTYYQWDTTTTATENKIITNAFLTAPEKKYQLAKLTDENGDLTATSRVYFNIGEYGKTAVRDTYRRSQEYQQRLATYLNEVLSEDKEIDVSTIPATLKNNPFAAEALSGSDNEENSTNVTRLIKEKFKGRDIFRTIGAFFANIGAKWGNSMAVSSQMETVSMYHFDDVGNRRAFKEQYSTSGDFSPYMPEGFSAEVAALDPEPDSSKELFEAKREKLLTWLDQQSEKTVEELQEEGKGASFTLDKDEMAFVIYLFETNEVIPNGTVGVELELVESYRDYVDTTGLGEDKNGDANAFAYLQDVYDEEFEAQFTEKVKGYLETYAILGDNNFFNALTFDESTGLYKPANNQNSDFNAQDSYSVYETGDWKGNPVNREADPVYSATLNPFPGYVMARTFYNLNNVGSAYSTTGSSYTTGGGTNTTAPGSSYAASSQVYSSAASAKNQAEQAEDIKNHPEKYVSRVINTNLYSKYISSGYLPTSVSYSYGKKLTALAKEGVQEEDGIVGWFKTKLKSALQTTVNAASGFVDDIVNSVNISSASAGTGDMLVSLGAGEDESWGYDINKEIHKGETQLVNLFDNSFGRDMVQFYTGINIDKTSSEVTNSDGTVRDGIWKLGQRFLKVIDSKAAYESDEIGKVVNSHSATKDGTTYAVWEKQRLDGEYEYRVNSAILDLDKNRVRDDNYDILPYEVRSVRDYGLASIMEYMEGLSVSFKRGLYYDETYTPYAANAFIYWLQQQQETNGTYEGIDVSNYEFGDTNKIYTDLERGFYPKEYFDIEGADGAELLKDKFILGDTTKLGENIGNGAAGSVLSPASDFMQGTSTTEPDTTQPELPTIDLSGDYSTDGPAGGVIVDGVTYRRFVYNGKLWLLLGEETTADNRKAYQLSNGDYTESFVVVETDNGKYEKVSGTLNGNQTVTGSFYDSAENDGIATSGTVTSVDTIYLGPYYSFYKNSSFTSTINFNFFVPYKATDSGPETYKDPKMYYLNWMVRANSLNSNGEIITKNAAQQLADSRTYTLASDMVTADGQIGEINSYFRKDDSPYLLPLGFASNLYGVRNANTYGFEYVKPESALNEKKTSGTIFSNGQDEAIYNHYLTGEGKKDTVTAYSSMINEFDYINLTSTESMFLISQVVTFLGRFEYTYRDTMENTGPLSKYDEHRLIGLYYYDRYVQVNQPKYVAVYWKYGKFENEDTSYGDSDAKADVESRINHSNYFGTLVDNNPHLLGEFAREYQAYLDECNGDGYYWYHVDTASITCTWEEDGPPDKDGKPTKVSMSHSMAHNLISYKILQFEEISLDSDAVSPFIENWDVVQANPSVRIYDDLIAYTGTDTYDIARSPMPIYTMNEKLNNLNLNGDKIGGPMSIYEIDRSAADAVDLTKQVSVKADRNASHDDTESKNFVLPYVLDTHGFMSSLGSTMKSEAQVTQTKTISVSCGEHDNSDETECTYITPGMAEYGDDSVSMPVLMLLDSTNTGIGALRGTDKSIDTRTTGESAPLCRNYFGANWKIYLKELKSYFDGETIPSWGNRVLYLDNDNFNGINPNYVTYYDDMKLEREKKTQYFDAYLAHFETYVPRSIKMDSDLAERVDLVQDFAKLTEDGKPWTTTEIMDLFLNEAGESYWTDIYKRWDTIFEEVGLDTMTTLQKQKAFAQILQGIFEARAERAVEENLKLLETKGIDSSRDENKEIMRNIIKLSCGASSDPGTDSDPNSLRGFIRRQKFYKSGETEGTISVKYEEIPYIGWACMSIDGGEYKGGAVNEACEEHTEDGVTVREIYHLDSAKRFVATNSNTTITEYQYDDNGNLVPVEIPIYSQNGFWVKDDSVLNHPIVIKKNSRGEIVSDTRLVATEMLPFIAYKFAKNLNEYKSLQQAIFATTTSNWEMNTLKAAHSDRDFTLSADFNDGDSKDGDYLSQVLSFIQNKSVRQTVSRASIGTSSGWFVDMESATDFADSVKNVINGLGLGNDKYNVSTLKSFHSTYGTIAPGESVDIPISDGYYGTKTFTLEPWQGKWSYWQNAFKNVALNLANNTGVYTAYSTDDLPAQAPLFDENGMGKVGERFIAATSSYLGVPGDYLDVYFEGSETPLKIIVGDCKSTADPNIHKYGHLSGSTLNVLEFMVNWNESKWGPVEADGTGIWTDGTNQEFYPIINEAIGLTADGTKRNVVKVVNLGSYFIDPEYAGTSQGQELYGVSSRSNIAAELKKLSLKDYRAFASTAIQLVSRPQNLDDIEDIKKAAVKYKLENNKDLMAMDENELFGDAATFNILDLLGNINGKGIYNKTQTGSLSYQWTGTYENFDGAQGYVLDEINWQEFEGEEKYVNLDVCAIALREAANGKDDGNGRKYIEAYHNSSGYGWEYWCMEFCQWCERQLGFTDEDKPNSKGHEAVMPKTASCSGMVDTMKTGAYGGEVIMAPDADYNPPPGAFVIFLNDKGNPGHVGLIIGCDENYFYTVEGDTTDPFGSNQYKWVEGYNGYQTVSVQQNKKGGKNIHSFILFDYSKGTPCSLNEKLSGDSECAYIKPGNSELYKPYFEEDGKNPLSAQ